MQLRARGGFGRLVSLSIRGTDSQQSLVIYDDVPLNSSIGGGFDLSLLDIGTVDRLEVYRGGSAVLGSSAIGGAVRVVPKPVGTSPGARGTLSVGSFGTVGLAAGAEVPLGANAGVAVSASLRQSRGDFTYVDTNGASRRRVNNESMGLAAGVRGRVELGRGWTLSLAESFRSEERGIPGVEQFESPAADQSADFNLLLLRLQRRAPANEAVDWRISAWHRYLHTRFADPGPPTIPTNNDLRGQSVGTAATAEWYVADDHTLEFRLDGAFDWADVRREDIQNNHERGTVGVVAAYEWSLFDGRMLVQPSVRLDWISTVGVVPLPQLGLRFELAPGTALRAKVARAYRLPTFEELYVDTDGIRGNPNLDPEDAISADIGVEWQRDWARASATLFWLRNDNLILFLPASTSLIQAENSGRVETLGLELALELTPIPWLEISAGYSLVDARFEGENSRLPGPSPHRVDLGLGGGLRPWAWLAVGAHWQDAFPLDRFGNLADEEARWLVDLELSSQPTPWLSLAVRVQNALDKADAVDFAQYPLPGLSALGTASVDW